MSLYISGVLCHFEDMSLRDQYFLEPQWLCDQLARVVSIKEVQQYCKNGNYVTVILKQN